MPFKQFLASFRHACRGVYIVFRHERNFRVQALAAVTVFVFASLFQVEIWEFILLILLSTSVLVLELFNSVIERMANGLSPRLQPIVRDIKDLMAAAVLIASLCSVVVGLIIFLPHLLPLLRA